MIRTDFQNLKVGDELTRVLAGAVSMIVVVGHISDTTFKVGSKDGLIPWEKGWTFNKQTGLEVDEDLGWNGVNITGSYISEQ